MSDPFRYFNSSPEVIRLVVMMYVKYPLSLRNVEDLLAERGINISHETVRFWWNLVSAGITEGMRVLTWEVEAQRLWQFAVTARLSRRPRYACRAREDVVRDHIRTAPSLALDTRAAYSARTPSL